MKNRFSAVPIVFLVLLVSINSNPAFGLPAVQAKTDSCNITLATTLFAICDTTCSSLAAVSAQGGDGPYTYVWSDTSLPNSALITGLCPGIYTVTVTDINLCLAVASIALDSIACCNIQNSGITQLTPTSVRLNWSGIPGVTDYLITGQNLTSMVQVSITMQSTFLDITGLTPLNTYAWSVSPIGCTAGPVTSSPPDTFTTPDYCPPPITQGVTSVGGSRVTVNWIHPTNAKKYTIAGRELGTIPVVFEEFIANGNPPDSRSIKGLQPNTTYEWALRAFCDNNTLPSPYSAVDTFTTGPPCLPPSGLNVTSITSSSAILTWTVAPNAVSYYMSGKVAGTTGGTNVVISNPNQTSFFVQGLTPNTTYQWTIRSNCPALEVSDYAPLNLFTTLPSATEKQGDEKVESENLGNIKPRFLVYPNPVEDELFIQTNVDQEQAISIFDLSGKLMRHFQQVAFVNGGYTLDVSQLTTGIYQLHLVSDEFSIQRRIVVL